MSIEQFKARLRSILKIDLEILVNENRSVMLNLLDVNRFFARLSVHKMFLDAPDPVLLAIAQYVRGKQKVGSVLRRFIQEHFANYDYTYLVDQKRCVVEGNHYNLKELYEALHKQYFEGKLDLSITWYGQAKKRLRPSSITFGQYLSGLRLIKIHRILDNPFFPDYFVKFVIYHEILHSVIGGTVDRRGRYCFHSSAFKERERVFEHYKRAVDWEKLNKNIIFKYGWT